MAVTHPEFTHVHDIADNYHAVREIILGGSVTWAGANARFQPFSGANVLDLGANTGIYSAYCALRGARVVAYEPFREAFELLTEMNHRAGLNIKAINAAVWTFNLPNLPYLGTVSSLDGACKTYNGSIPLEGVRFVEEDYRNAQEIQCESFDRVLAHSSNWDMVKMDIEGAEFDVLLMASEVFLNRIKFLYVEFHPWANEEIYKRTIQRLEYVFDFEGAYFNNDLGRWEAAYCTRK